MSSISKSPSNNMINFESSQESSWTKYFEDFFNNDDHNNIIDNHNYCSINSNFSAFDDDGSSSLASQGGMEYIKRLSFKKRKKIKTSLVDHDLEDTASSPINSPKVFKGKEKGKFDQLYKEKGNVIREKDERKEVEFNEKDITISSNHTELNKKGLCLVPMSMVINYIG